MRLVVAGLHVGAAGPLLQPRLGHAQRRVLGRNVGLEAFQVALLLGDFLKFGIRIKCAPPPTSSIGSNGKVINNTRFHLLPLICTNLIKKRFYLMLFMLKLREICENTFIPCFVNKIKISTVKLFTKE